jgi:hypothetical protein
MSEASVVDKKALAREKRRQKVLARGAERLATLSQSAGGDEILNDDTTDNNNNNNNDNNDNNNSINCKQYYFCCAFLCYCFSMCYTCLRI